MLNQSLQPKSITAKVGRKDDCLQILLESAQAPDQQAIVRAGERASWRFIEFFTANIRNKNTRAAYAKAVVQFFDWCEHRRLVLDDIEPMAVAAYIEQSGR